MPATAVALVLFAALLHAAWNIAAKHANGDHRLVLMNSVLIALVWAPIGAWAAWNELARWGALEWALCAASAFLHFLYFNVLLKGYRVADLTVVYPVARGTAPLLSAFAALALLQESMTAVAVAGVFGIACGVFLVAGGPALWKQRASPRLRAGLGWGAMCGAIIACYTVLDGYAVKVVLISPILIDYVGNLLRTAMAVPRVLRDPPGAFRQAWRTQWRHALLIATIAPLSYILVLYAARMAPLSHVAPMREVAMLFAAAFGGRLLGEQDRGMRLLGAGCVAAGVAALAW